MAAPLVRLDRLVPGYGRRGILGPIDFAIGRGELWALIGRNGAGKSTLLRTLIGLQPPVSGAVVRQAGLRASWVPQRGDYDPSVPARVLDLVRGGVDRGWSFLEPGRVRAAKERVGAAMCDTAVIDLGERRFSQLSEGQKQRVLIARALAGEPELIVLDEPTSAMDHVAERSVLELLDGLRRSRGLALVLASHHLSLLTELATHAILVDSDDGIAVHGPIAEVVAREEFTVRYGAVVPPRLAARGDDAV